ncbi:MAG: hypothetical protein ACQESG_07740 [Nanobdellota archaeon]
MRIDLVQAVEGFDYESGLAVEGFLQENAQLVGQPYNHHDVAKGKPIIQILKAHYRIGGRAGCDIYQAREVHYTFDGECNLEIQNELLFSGDQTIAQGFLERLLDSLKPRWAIPSSDRGHGRSIEQGYSSFP